MAHTYKATVLAMAIKDLIEANKATLGINEVYYGDHNNIPVGISAAITAGTKHRDLAGVSGPGGRSMNTLNVVIFIYYSVVEAEATARLAVDQIGEAVEDLLHTDTTMGGLLIHGFVQDVIPGTVFKENSMFRAVELDYQGKTKTNIT